MYQRLRRAFPAAVAWGVLLLTQPALAQTNLLVNGDFEDLTNWGAFGDPVDNKPAGWRENSRANPAIQQSGANAIGGSGTSAFLQADAGATGANQKDIVQFLETPTSPLYRFAFDFASEDPGGSGDRSLSMSTGDGANRALRTTFRINGDGDFQTFTANTWQTLLPGAIVFDDDVSVSPLVHHIEFTVDSINGNFDLSITDSNSVVHAVTESTMWRGTPPVGAGGSRIEFNTFISAGDYLLDNVSLVDIPPDLQITIDRDSGAVTLTNNGDPVSLAAYTLSSDVAAFNAGNWKSIADNYDVDGPNTADGGALIGSVDPNNAWSELGTPNDFELAESELFDQGATLANGQTIELGTGTWRPSPFEDVEVQVLLAGGTVASAGVRYVGNDGEPFAVGDLDLDGDVDIDDFKNEFLPNYFANTSSDTPVLQYFAGDWNNDGETGFQDFLLFNAAYIAANPGAEALSLSASVPEPGAGLLMGLALAIGSIARRRVVRLQRVLITCLAIVGLSVASASAQNLLINGDFEDTTDWGFPGDPAESKPPAWRDATGQNPAAQQFDSFAIGGSGVSALMQTGIGSIRQILATPTSPALNFQLDVASADPGDDTMRALSGSLRDGNGSASITFRVVDENDDGVGDLQFFSGAWEAGVLPNSIVFSDVLNAPLANNISIYLDTGVSSPTFDVTVTDANDVEHRAEGLSFFNSSPDRYGGSSGVDFNTNLSTADYLLDNVMIENAISASALTLGVVKATGDVLLANNTGEPVVIDAYRIFSEMGGLNFGEDGWSSLEEQAWDGSPGSPVWSELGRTSSELSEGYLGGDGTTLDPGQSINLGRAYNTSMDTEDLQLEFHPTDAPPLALPGVVTYIEDAVPGDYNGDFAVNAADYTVWRDALGSTVANPFDGADGNGNGMIDSGDYDVWKSSFGTSFGSASLVSTAAVPEPATAMLAVFAGLALMAIGKLR